MHGISDAIGHQLADQSPIWIHPVLHVNGGVKTRHLDGVKDGVVAALFRRHRNVPRWLCSNHKEKDDEMKNTMIGVDLAKNVF